MRPIVSEQNPLCFPLNELLGTEAHVRLLRVLANDVDGPLSVSDVAKRAGLTSRGAQKALKRLVQSGFVLLVGGGRKHQFELRRADKLMQAVLKLFRAESNMYEAFLNAIREKIEIHGAPPLSVWIEEFPAELGDSLVLGVMHETRHLTNYIHRLRTKLRKVERDFDITIEVKGYTKADASVLNMKEVVHLYGVPPFIDKTIRKLQTNPQTHKEMHNRLLELARVLALYMEKDTSILRRAKEYVKRLLEKEQGAATRDIEEWRNILESYSIHRLSRLLISPSERANRLRQSCPLFAILTSDERNHLYDELGRNSDT